MSTSTEAVKEKIWTSKFIMQLGLLVLLSLLVFAWYYPVRSMAMGKWWQIGVVPFSALIMAILAIIIGKLTNKTIGVTSFILLCYTMTLVSGKMYYLADISDSGNLVDGFSLGWIIHWVGLGYPGGSSASYAAMFPDWLVVKDTAAVNAFLYGGPLNWGVWIAPAIAQVVVNLAFAVFGFSMMWFFMGPYFTEEERLVFPLVQPYVWIVSETIGQPEESRFRLFSFKMLTHRLFWIVFAIAFISNIPLFLAVAIPAVLPPFLAQFMGLPFGYVGVPWTTWFPALNPMYKNSPPGGLFSIAMWSLAIMMPLRFILTVLIVQFLFDWVYRYIAINYILPPGFSPGSSPPIPYWLLGTGMVIGLGVWVLWRLKGRFTKAFRALLGGPDDRVNDMSTRIGVLLLIISAVVFIVFYAAVGIPLGMMILYFIFNTIILVGGAKVFSAYQPYSGCCQAGNLAQMLFPIGAGVGLWNATPPNTSNYNLISTMTLVGIGGNCIGNYEGNSVLAMPQISETYGAAFYTKVNQKKLLIGIFTMIIFAIPFVIFYQIWFNTHVGITNTGHGGDLSWANFGGYGGPISYGVEDNSGIMVGNLGPEAFWGIIIVGTILVFLIEIMRMKFPWFWLDSVAVASGLEQTSFLFFPCILALIIKFALIRTLGPRRTMEVLIPIATGAMVGASTIYLLVYGIIMFNASIPNLTLLWKP